MVAVSPDVIGHSLNGLALCTPLLQQASANSHDIWYES